MAIDRDPDPDDARVGAQIRMRRQNLRISQSTLATSLGVSFQQVQRYERGTNRLSPARLLLAAERLGCAVQDLEGKPAGVVQSGSAGSPSI